MIYREDVGDVAVLRVEHGKANAIDVELFEQLDARLDEVSGSPSARAVVLTGTGSIFSAGVDLFQVVQGGADYVEAFLPRLTATLTRLFTFPRPVVAAVNGHALAGGLILALAADYRVLAEGKAKLGLTEMQVGVPFPAAALEIVRFQVPGRIVQDLVLSGRTFPGGEARELRLVDEIVPEGQVVERAVEVASRLGAVPGPSFALSKRHLRADAGEAIERRSQVIDPEVLAIWSHPDTLRSIGQFLDKTVGKKG